MIKPTRRHSGNVTMKDVASEIGVSVMTVSQVINDEPGASATTRKVVLDAVRKLNYVPHAGARSLASGLRLHIGVLLGFPTMADEGACLRGALTGAMQSGAQLSFEICQLFNHEDPLTAIRRLAQSGAAAIILSPPFCESDVILASITRIGLQAVTLGASQKQGYMNFRFDQSSGALGVTRHLISLGHTRIAHIKGAENHLTSGERWRGYELAMKEAGLAVMPDWIEPGDFSYKSGVLATRKLLLLSEPPTAIFAANDEMASAAINVAHYCGLPIPADISIVGFGDTPAALCSWPELTAARQPLSEMTQAAVIWLSQHLTAGTGTSHFTLEECVLDFASVVRESAGEVPSPRKIRPLKNGPEPL